VVELFSTNIVVGIVGKRISLSFRCA